MSTGTFLFRKKHLYDFEPIVDWASVYKLPVHARY